MADGVDAVLLFQGRAVLGCGNALLLGLSGNVCLNLGFGYLQLPLSGELLEHQRVQDAASALGLHLDPDLVPVNLLVGLTLHGQSVGEPVHVLVERFADQPGRQLVVGEVLLQVVQRGPAPRVAAVAQLLVPKDHGDPLTELLQCLEAHALGQRVIGVRQALALDSLDLNGVAHGLPGAIGVLVVVREPSFRDPLVADLGPLQCLVDLRRDRPLADHEPGVLLLVRRLVGVVHDTVEVSLHQEAVLDRTVLDRLPGCLLVADLVQFLVDFRFGHIGRDLGKLDPVQVGQIVLGPHFEHRLEHEAAVLAELRLGDPRLGQRYEVFLLLDEFRPDLLNEMLAEIRLDLLGKARRHRRRRGLAHPEPGDLGVPAELANDGLALRGNGVCGDGCVDLDRVVRFAGDRVCHEFSPGGAKGGTRTPTGQAHEILSLARLPVPPLSQRMGEW
jgi:hypothetical protein